MATNKLEQLCLLTIAYREYVMPIDAGLALMKLLSKAVEVDSDFGGIGDEVKYIVKGPVAPQMKIIRPDQIDMPCASPTAGRRAKQKQLPLEQS